MENGKSTKHFTFSRLNLPKNPFINNTYTKSTESRKLSVYNPKDGKLVADDVAVSGSAEVDAAVWAAEAAFPAWRKTPAPQRKAILEKFADLVESKREQLDELTRITLGSPRSSQDIDFFLQGFRYFAGWVDKFAGESYPQDGDGFLKIISNEPYGVTAGILPWNGTLCFIGLKAAPALAAGNCFIIKPSEKTPFAALALGPLIIEAGFPPGVLQVLPGDGSTGALLASHMRIRKISLTGSVSTGKKIQALAAASNLKEVTLELGGKSPAVVFDDANIDNAVFWTVMMITLNAGQICFSPTRIYVQAGVFDQFVEKYKVAILAATKGMGDPDDESTRIGPLVDKAHFNHVTGFIERAKDTEARLLVGGKFTSAAEKGCFVDPTVYTHVAPNSELAREEIFGPVSFINRFDTEDEAVRLSNDTHFGLMAGVFTQDINRALRVSSMFESGMVGINCVGMIFMNCPFGGSKESGIGRECGVNAMKAWTETKTTMINLNC